MSDVTMISYALIKMFNTGLYGKPIKRWNERAATDRKLWAVLFPAMVAEYERMLREGGGPQLARRDTPLCLWQLDKAEKKETTFHSSKV